LWVLRCLEEEEGRRRGGEHDSPKFVGFEVLGRRGREEEGRGWGEEAPPGGSPAPRETLALAETRGGGMVADDRGSDWVVWML
jgi:hypothetical protein